MEIYNITIILMALVNIMIAVLYINIWNIDDAQFIRLWKNASIWSAASHILAIASIFVGDNEFLNRMVYQPRYSIIIISIIYFVYGVCAFVERPLIVPVKYFILFFIGFNIAAIGFGISANYFLDALIDIIEVSLVFVAVIYLKQIKGYRMVKLCIAVLIAMLLIFIYGQNSYTLDTEKIMIFYVTYLILQMMIYGNFLFIYFRDSHKELQNLKDEIEKSKERLKTIIDNQRDVIFELDSCGKFLFVSDSISSIFNCAASDIIGQSINRFFMEKYNMDGIADFLGDYIDEEVNVSDDCSGSRILNIVVQALPEKTGYVGSIRDVTSHRLLDTYIKKDKVKIESFTNLSHDLRAPLNVINSTIQVMDIYIRENVEDRGGKLSYYLSIANKNIYRLIRLVNNIIDVSKMNSGNYLVNMGYGNLVEEVEETFMLTVDYAKKKNINMSFDTMEEEIYCIFDKDKIERIIYNLISNAIKFTPDGGSIIVTMKRSYDTAIISVEDDGIGIPEDEIGCIFNRFEQGIYKTRPNSGSGLGLNIVKLLVEMHNGTIEAVNAPVRGTRFIISIPIVQNEELQKSLCEYDISERKAKIELSDI